MHTLELSPVLGSCSSRWAETETALLMFADFMSVSPGSPAKRIAELKQSNARLRAKCEQQRLLMAELGHRVKNSLALVQALVNQTLREEASVEAARNALTARIAALGQSHALLIDESWAGANLKQVVDGAISVHGARTVADRFDVSGPSVRLQPRQMLALSMALHELGTNAAKYGALSVATGRVEVTWTTTRSANGRTLRLQWREAGGPPVLPPTRRGFGSKLIERALRDAMDGEVSLTFKPTGVMCTVMAHLAPTVRKSGTRETAHV